MPFALGMVRKLAAEGREIYAADDHSLSPGNHSKYLAGHFVYPSPRSDTAAFLAELERIVQEHEIDVIVPAFEEAFYISTQIERLSQSTKVFASPFRTLAQLHDKGAFHRLVTRLGLPVPEMVLVTSDQELRDATDRLGRHFARGVFSRGGVCCLTNTGPLAGALEIDEVHPSLATPWLVQPFLDVETVCTYTTADQGRVSSHLMYQIPRQRKHSTGIQFEAIDATASLKLMEPIVAELGYTGQISFDFLVTDDGLTFVEGNPRATDGLLLMPQEELVAGLLAPRPKTFVVKPGGQVQLSLAVLADGFRRSAGPPAPVNRRPRAGPRRRQRLARPAAHPVFGARDLPLRRQSFREHTGQLAAIAGDMNWDGEHIDGISTDNATLLTGLRPQPGET
jgi:hypothetical protein